MMRNVRLITLFLLPILWSCETEHEATGKNPDSQLAGRKNHIQKGLSFSLPESFELTINEKGEEYYVNETVSPYGTLVVQQFLSSDFHSDALYFLGVQYSILQDKINTFNYSRIGELITSDNRKFYSFECTYQIDKKSQTKKLFVFQEEGYFILCNLTFNSTEEESQVIDHTINFLNSLEINSKKVFDGSLSSLRELSLEELSFYLKKKYRD